MRPTTARLLRSALAAALLLSLAGSRLAALQTDNHGIHAVPAPGPVTIDGKLDDWDLSGQILICYDVQSLKDVFSGQVAMMHTPAALYVAIHWKAPMPMSNSHDPRFQAGKGWAGDAIQMRFKTDRILHLTAWYYGKKDEPFFNIAYGKSLTEPFNGGEKNFFRTDGWKMDGGAEMAFAKDADGKGYVQEIKLPWELITLTRRYAPGESFRCGIELLWGGADWPVHRYADNLADGATSREFFWTAHDAWGPVIIEEKGNLKLPTQPWEKPAAEEETDKGPVALTYELPRDSRVTLAVNDVQGTRVRNLLAAAERKAGKNTDYWDGLNDAGEVVPPGTYTISGLYHDGLHAKFALSYASPANPGWKTADGKGSYYGDHTAPQAVVAGKDLLALACPMGEAGDHLIGVDMQGRRQWALANRVFAVATRVGLATDGNTLWIACGERASSGNYSGGRFFIWRCELRTGNYAPWKRTGPDGKPVLDLEITPDQGDANCRMIAWHNGRLAVIAAADRRLLLLDAETGDVRQDFKNMPDGMAACAFAADGTLYLAAGQALYVVDTRTGKLEKRLDGLDEPQGLAVAPNGSLYISQRGKKQNVEIYAADGRKTGAIGKVGGRPAVGFFDPSGMLNPAQIALDAQGRLWVPEENLQPKRTSVWGPDGKVVLDLVGSTAYSAGGLVNPLDHTRAFCELVEYKLDYAKQSFRPLYTLPDAIGTGLGWISRIVKVNGREYAQARSTARDAGMVKLFVRAADGSWRHVAEWGNAGLGKALDDKQHAEWNKTFSGPLWDGAFGKGFLWVDKNDDGVAQREEIEFSDQHLGRYYWGQMMGEDLNVVIPVGKENDFLSFKPQGYTTGGTPLYTFGTAATISTTYPAGEGMMAVGRDGRLYLNQSPLMAVNPAGKALWTYPSRYVSVHGSHTAPAPSPGLLIGPSSFYGTAFIDAEVGEVFYLNGNLGQNFIFTEDGLWVQSLYNDCRGWFDVPAQAVPGMPCDAMSAGGESFGGGFCRSDDGKFYAVGGGTAAIVSEITGLDTLKRFNLAATVAVQDVAAAQEIKVRRAARASAKKAYVVKAAAAPLAADGNLVPWEMEKNSLEIQTGRDKVATVKAAYDAANLYLAWQVNDRSPLKNAGQDERLMFITGDCVDLMLRTDAAATAGAPVKGDLRLLFTVKGGKPLAVLYEPVSPDAPKAERGGFSSPWRVVQMDRVRSVEVPVTLKLIPGGYAVTAAVPLSLLGTESLKGKVLRGDFGVLGSDSAGQECTSRNYWSNKNTNNTNDIPDEVMLTPALWGELRFE